MKNILSRLFLTNLCTTSIPGDTGDFNVSIEEYLLWIEKIIKKLNNVSKYNCSLWIFGFPYQLSYIIPIVEKYGFK